MSERTNTAKWVESRQRWQINVQKDGVRKTFVSSKPGRAGQRESNKKADEWLQDGTISTAIKVAAAWNEFLESKRNVSEIEYGKAEGFGRLYLLPALGKRTLKAVTERDLQDVLDYAFKHPASDRKQLSRKTLTTFMACEKQFIKYCRKSKWTTLFPEDLRVPAAARKCEKHILQIQDMIKLFNIDTTLYRGKRERDQYINYYRFQVLTGLRPGELRGLRWSDIRGNVCCVHGSINVHGEETMGKNDNAHRSFVLIPLAMRVLEDQKQDTGDFEFIFPMHSMHTYYGRWQTYQKANDITPPLSLYEMRHTFVSATKSLPEGQLKQLVGHSQSMDTYGTYSHLLSNDAEDTAKAVQDIFSSLFSV